MADSPRANGFRLADAMPQLIRKYWPWLALATLSIAAWLAYRPGLAGGFLFDDFINLPALGSGGTIDNWPAFWRYITSGFADPTGRPLSMLSFLVDARDWPADPAPFLRTNVFLHLVNGALLFVLLRRLGHGLDADDRRNSAAALLGAGLWLLHPLFVSTTLYIVQREAMLPASFILLGLLAYLHGRTLYTRQPRSGAAWMVVGIGLGTLLALLCKGNGILLPLLAWVLEATVLDHRRDDPGHDRQFKLLRNLLLVLPSALVLLYLSSFLPALHAPLEHRPWTIAQRLLTEPRILLEYLHLLAVPSSMSSGLYNDAFQVSQGWWQPAGTLLSLLLILALAGVGFATRKRAPSLSAALLFFFAGHLLESTVIPLELYFEHRNYLPAMLLFWPLARGLCAWRVSASMRSAVAISLLALLGFTTWQRAQLWGQQEKQALLWARSNPDSSRAQSTAASWETANGHPEHAVLRLAPLWRERPNDVQIAFNYINAACAWRGVSETESRAIADALEQTSSGGQLIYRWLEKALAVAANGSCPGMNLGDVELWLDAAQKNPAFSTTPGRRQDMENLRGQLALSEQRPDQALEHFDLALALFVTPDAAARQAALLASHGDYQLALEHLDNYERLKDKTVKPRRGMPQLHERVLQWQGYWPREIAALREKLHTELAARTARTAQGS